MKKIPTLFLRDEKTHRVIDAVTPGCEWVLAGEGEPTVKYDGTACLIQGRQYMKRHTFRIPQPAPAGFVPEGDTDPETGAQPGWVPVGINDHWHLEAWREGLPDGTYELCGPKINGNPEGCSEHFLLKHGHVKLSCPRTFGELKAWLETAKLEGVVWWHPDGRKAKIKRRDFGYPWPIELKS